MTTFAGDDTREGCVIRHQDGRCVGNFTTTDDRAAALKPGDEFTWTSGIDVYRCVVSEPIREIKTVVHRFVQFAVTQRDQA